MSQNTIKFRKKLFKEIVSDTYPATDRLRNLLKLLRHPDYGCDWDKQQSFESLKPYTLEEAYEVADAIEENNPEDLRNELGDLLLQVYFHAQIAEDQNYFTFEDVAKSIVEKMVYRHPHIFDIENQQIYDTPTQVEQITQVKVNWEKMKEAERKAKNEVKQTTHQIESALDGVAMALPSLIRAEKLQKRAAHVGFDWDDPQPILQKIIEEINEFQHEVEIHSHQKMISEMGDILFAVVNLARYYQIDPEQALHQTNQKFIKRFQGMEKDSRDQQQHLQDMSLKQLEILWCQQKKEGIAKLNCRGSDLI